MNGLWKWMDNHLIECIIAILVMILISLVAIPVVNELNMTPEAKAQQQARREQENRDALLARAEALGRSGVIAKHPAGFCFFYGETNKRATIVFNVPCPKDETR